MTPDELITSPLSELEVISADEFTVNYPAESNTSVLHNFKYLPLDDFLLKIPKEMVAKKCATAS